MKANLFRSPVAKKQAGKKKEESEDLDESSSDYEVYGTLRIKKVGMRSQSRGL